MKSVDFTVQRLIETSSNSRTGLQCRSQSPPEDKHDHVTSDDVDNDVTADGERSTGARNDDYDEIPSRAWHEGHVAPMLIHPSIYLDYARQFLWHLSAAYRPG